LLSQRRGRKEEEYEPVHLYMISRHNIVNEV
jgi:hypothetical protein